jgi:hypothetical protein
MIDDALLQRYREDSAVVLRGLLDDAAVERLREAVETVLGSLSAHGNEYAKPGEARFAQDMFMAQRPDAAGDTFCRLVHESPLAEAAGLLMGAREVRFFYDQLFVKEPGSVAPTPWHQDLPYWPLRGDQICGLWCPLDPVDLDSGAVEYVRGSHRSGRWYRLRHFGGDAGYGGAPGEPMPDNYTTVAAADRMSWATCTRATPSPSTGWWCMAQAATAARSAGDARCRCAGWATTPCSTTGRAPIHSTPPARCRERRCRVRFTPASGRGGAGRERIACRWLVAELRRARHTAGPLIQGTR